MKKEIPNLRDNIQFEGIDRDIISQLVSKIPSITFEDVLKTHKIQCGQRSIADEVKDVDDNGEVVSINEIQATLFVKQLTSGGSIKMNGNPR